MEKLPQEIAMEIFYRLPPESVVQCKLVCKSWCSLLPAHGDDGNYFANMHLLRRRHHQQRNLDYSTLNFIAIHEKEEDGISKFRISEYDQVVEELNCPKVKRLNFSQFCCITKHGGGKTKLVGSCNGLVCVCVTSTNKYYDNRIPANCMKDKIGICNPFLHEYVTLPLSYLQFKYNDFNVNCIDIGFGHNPTTDEYKVVRVYRRCNMSSTGDVEVYTLGKSSSTINGGMWRSKGTINFFWGDLGTHHWRQSWSQPPVFINGSIHWLASTWEDKGLFSTIVSFDLDDEEFRLIPLPSSNRELNCTSFHNFHNCDEIIELRGCLCLIEKSKEMDEWVFDPRINDWAIDPNRSFRHILDIWVLKDYMNKESWVKEFSTIKCEGAPWDYSTCAIKKKNKDGDGDEILFWCSGKGLVSYDPKTQNYEEVVGGRQIVSESMHDPASVLHINSFVSLKALGEDTKHAENHYAKYAENHCFVSPDPLLQGPGLEAWSCCCIHDICFEATQQSQHTVFFRRFFPN